jgi:hypothetical protein
MKKIVINCKYGGFGLSYLGVKTYAQLCDTPIYFFRYIRETNKYEPVSEDEVFNLKDRTLDILPFIVPNPSEVLGDKKFHERNDEEKIEFNEKYNSIYFNDDEIERDDIILIKTIEELGEKANGFCSNLKIVEIPDDVDWVIEDYDGLEWVAEKHRTWS